MCELFAMSSRNPSAVTYSLPEFAANGAKLRSNRSGWGIAYLQQRDAFLVKEAEPASDSAWVDFIAHQRMSSRCVIAHVRYATVGVNALHNTHPFRRALGRRFHIFAHNGTLAGLHDQAAGIDLAARPVGDTDSELAFCLLLERLRPLWRQADAVPTLDDRMASFTGFAADMAAIGPSNFVYTDGDALFVHAHKRVYEEDGALTPPRAPGLTMRNCVDCAAAPEWHCNGLDIELGDQQTILFASVPLDDQGWEPLPEGTAIAVRDGAILARRSTL